MSGRFFWGSLLGFLVVVLLYAKLADVAEGATAGTPVQASPSDSLAVSPNPASSPALPPEASSEPTASPVSWSGWVMAASVVVLLGGIGFLGLEVREKLKARDRYETDPPLLEELFRTFADKISGMLATPRQIKRFSSKVRLQHNLMHNLARQQKHLNSPDPFLFSPNEQILAFLYVLLIERDREMDHSLMTGSKEEFHRKLRSLAKKEFSAPAFLSDGRISGGAKAAERLRQEEDGNLIHQLCRLNFGALV